VGGREGKVSHPERIAGLVVMDIAPVTYSVSDGTNWQDTHEVGRERGRGGGRDACFCNY